MNDDEYVVSCLPLLSIFLERIGNYKQKLFLPYIFTLPILKLPNTGNLLNEPDFH